MALPLHRLQEGAHEFPHGRPGPVRSTATAPGTAWDGSAPTAAADSSQCRPYRLAAAGRGRPGRAVGLAPAPADHHADLVRRPPRRGMRRGGRLRTVRQHGVVAINFSNEAMQSGQ
ncbi:hypothetical protein RKD29_000581 [Streptomyces tendae]|uniref:hypothetical protein n=1 Tax=Streptomyces tendae TaxID=1932 RepID=UPI0038324D39